MNLTSVLIGLMSFVIIGIFHPVVIKCEYHFSKKIWPVFFVAGIGLIALALFIKNILIASIVSITAFSCLWSIKELVEQEKRVAKGWFPKNPKRNDYPRSADKL